MSPLTDASQMTNIYNQMLKTTTPKTDTTFIPATNRINYSRKIGGVYFCFIQMWPDSLVKLCLNTNLQKVANTTPVIIVAHTQLGVVSNHFTNPNATFSINATDKFDHVSDEYFKGGKLTTITAIMEQRSFVVFLKLHTNTKAYQHGHVHENKYYVWNGPDNNVALDLVSADSQMKSIVSFIDGTKLSFHFAVLDPTTMTISECCGTQIHPSPQHVLDGGMGLQSI